MAGAPFWTKHVAAWRGSGQPAAEYCDAHGIGLSALRYWARKAQREPEPVVMAATPLVRLARVERVAAVVEARPAPVPVVIEVGGARVVVERGVDRATLATVLEALGAGAAR